MLRGYLELLRPPNVMTAVADVLAGYAVAGLSNWPALPWLLGATACLYAGGVVLNDFSTAISMRANGPSARCRAAGSRGGRRGARIGAADWRHRPRLPRDPGGGGGGDRDDGGRSCCMTAGRSARAPLGPVVMGACRGLNLLLGIAAAPAVLAGSWPLTLIPFTYIAAVTVVSRGEVHGGKRGPAALALVSLGGVVARPGHDCGGRGRGPKGGSWRSRCAARVPGDPAVLAGLSATPRPPESGRRSGRECFRWFWSTPPWRLRMPDRSLAQSCSPPPWSPPAWRGCLRLPEMDAIQQEIHVSFQYPVHFTTGVFSPGNTLLRDLAGRAGASGRRRMLVVLDSGVERAHPDLAGAVHQYFTAHQSASSWPGR